MGTSSVSPIMAEFVVANLTLHMCIEKQWQPTRLCCDCPGITSLMKHFNPCIAWHFTTEYENLKNNLKNFSNIFIETIPRKIISLVIL